MVQDIVQVLMIFHFDVGISLAFILYMCYYIKRYIVFELSFDRSIQRVQDRRV